MIWQLNGYLGGNCFEPDMSLFWPVDPDLAARIPAGMHNELARFQMCGKATVDFPGAWRANLMDVETERPSWAPDPHWGLEQSESGIPLCFRSEDALEEIANRCAVISLGDEQWQAALKALTASEAGQIIVEACLKHDVRPEELLAELSQFTFDH